MPRIAPIPMQELSSHSREIVEAGVAVVPGSGFGAPGHIRISFACSMATLEDALGRIRRVLGVAVAKRA